ncbi:MAG: DNA-binding protein [Candidatus Limnocylindrales bacterium]
MKQLIVRNIEDEVVRALKIQAARRGRSMEAEHREILRDTLLSSTGGPSFKDWMGSMPDVGDDEDLIAPRDLPHDVE